jgi:hypothetical protein
MIPFKKLLPYLLPSLILLGLLVWAKYFSGGYRFTDTQIYLLVGAILLFGVYRRFRFRQSYDKQSIEGKRMYLISLLTSANIPMAISVFALKVCTPEFFSQYNFMWPALIVGWIMLNVSIVILIIKWRKKTGVTGN